MTSLVSRILLALELLAVLAFLPGVVFVSFMMIDGFSLSIWTLETLAAGLAALAAWSAAFYEGLGYVRTSSLLDGNTPKWTRLTQLCGPIPALLVYAHVTTRYPRSTDPGIGIFVVACLIWVPVAHLEVVRIMQSRSNNRIERRVNDKVPSSSVGASGAHAER